MTVGEVFAADPADEAEGILPCTVASVLATAESVTTGASVLLSLTVPVESLLTVSAFTSGLLPV